MNTVFGTWYPPDETPGIGEGILIAGFEYGDREPVIADGFYDGENFRTRQSTVMDEVIAWMPKPKFPVGFKHVLMTERPVKSVCAGQHLFTRDGRDVGNAIVTEVTPENRVRIETDYGNRGPLHSLREINDWWHTTGRDGIACISELERWRSERQYRINITQELRDLEAEVAKHQA